MLRINAGEKIPLADILETPSLGLNYVLGGGFWTGRLTTLWGASSGGKTTFALHTIARAQEKGYIPFIIDAEGSITDAWMEKCGIDISKRIYLRKNITEDILNEIIPAFSDTNKKYIFLFDSINTITAESFYKEPDSGKAIAISARSQSYLCTKIINYLNQNNAAIFISQQSTHFSGQNAYVAAKIGHAIRHLSTNIIQISTATGKDDVERNKSLETIEKQRIYWIINKCKQSPSLGTKGYYWFSPAEAAIDWAAEAVDLAVRNGIIEKRGAWYNYDNKQYHGVSSLKEDILLYPEKIKEIMVALEDVELDFSDD